MLGTTTDIHICYHTFPFDATGFRTWNLNLRAIPESTQYLAAFHSNWKAGEGIRTPVAYATVYKTAPIDRYGTPAVYNGQVTLLALIL
jgi:hypothetical protein